MEEGVKNRILSLPFIIEKPIGHVDKPPAKNLNKYAKELMACLWRGLFVIHKNPTLFFLPCEIAGRFFVNNCAHRYRRVWGMGFTP